MGAADHHAVQRRRVLGDVDHDGPHLEDGRVVGLQASLGAVQGLRLGDVALHHRPENTAPSGMSGASSSPADAQLRGRRTVEGRFPGERVEWAITTGDTRSTMSEEGGEFNMEVE